MVREFKCPSCGAANDVTNPGVVMRVCDYCKTAMYWDSESVVSAGGKSLDLPPSSRFKVGGTGKISGQRFRVLGRLSYAHESGTWSEWFAEMQDGKIKWITEDEGELFIEEPVAVSTAIPRFEDLQPGSIIPINDKTGVVEEIGQARCLGGEGQIPFKVQIGETYPYADGAGADGSFSFGLEYDAETGAPTLFVGTALLLKEAKAKSDAREEPLEKVGEIIRCPSCGKPYEGLKAPTTKMVVCQACGAVLELDEAQARVVGKNKGPEPAFTFAVGAPITLEGTRYEVMGRLFYVEKDGGVEYRSYEYVLYHPEKGYLWLSAEDGHFTVSRVVHARVVIPPNATPKMWVKVGNEGFQFYESGIVALRWVDGALPWTAKVGEQTWYAHLIMPPDYADQERTGQEIELFRGRYLGREELQSGLPKDFRLPAEPSSVYSCQPYVVPRWLKGMGLIAVVFLSLNIVLGLYALAADKAMPLLAQQITAEQYKREYMTNPFTVARDGAILEISGSAPLNNSWMSLDFGIVNSNDEVVSELYKDISYYYGRDSEGSWTEGSHTFRSSFKVSKAGTYRLLIHGSSGAGETGPSRNEPLSIKVTEGHTIAWYFWIPILVSALLWFWEPARRKGFEGRRWAAVMPESDDDD